MDTNTPKAPYCKVFYESDVTKLNSIRFIFFLTYYDTRIMSRNCDIILQPLLIDRSQDLSTIERNKFQRDVKAKDFKVQLCFC